MVVYGRQGEEASVAVAVAVAVAAVLMGIESSREAPWPRTRKGMRARGKSNPWRGPEHARVRYETGCNQMRCAKEVLTGD